MNSIWKLMIGNPFRWLLIVVRASKRVAECVFLLGSYSKLMSISEEMQPLLSVFFEELSIFQVWTFVIIIIIFFFGIDVMMLLLVLLFNASKTPGLVPGLVWDWNCATQGVVP